MSTARSSRPAGKHKRRTSGRRRKAVAATGTMLLVAAAVAGEPAVIGTVAGGGAGGGLYGLTDPDSVSANGEAGADDRIGDEVLDSAGDIDKLRQLSSGDLPSGPLMIPGDLFKSYQQAAQMLATDIPSCRIHWSLLASIGRIESNHARGGQVDAKGNTVPHILGPVLNGGGFAAIRDTDDGALDEDPRWDRAVGSMQFIPSTWAGYAADGNNDGVSSPHNIYDASLAAGKYLCSGGLDLSKPKDQAVAVFRYNHSDSYVTTVLIWADAYKNGTNPLPTTPVDPAELAALGPPPAAQRPGGGAQKPKPNPGSSTTSNSRPPSPSSPRPPSSSSSATSTSPSCPTPTSTTTTTTTTTPPTTSTPNPSCPTPTPPSSSSSSASQGSSVTPTSPAPTSSAPGGAAGSSVMPSP